MLNAQKGTGFNVKTQTPSTRADGFDVDCTGNERPLRVLSLGKPPFLCMLMVTGYTNANTRRGRCTWIIISIYFACGNGEH